MIAILSDIHANLEALRAVLDDAVGRGARQVYCLGDTVGYGPDPEACVALVRDFDIVLRDQFDEQVLSDDPDSLPTLRNLARWARNQLAPASLDFLAARSARHSLGSWTFSHGGPLDNGYLFPEDVYNGRKMTRVFACFDGAFFCGHSHVAGIHSLTEYITPPSIGDQYTIGDAKVVINVGSAGQPRDGDPRASYVLVEGMTVRFMRCVYDVDSTIRKLRDRGFGSNYWDIE